MFYAFILLSLVSFSVQAMEEQPIVLWALHEIVLTPKAPTWLPTRLSPKYYENELLKAVNSNTDYHNDSAAKHPSKLLPLGIRAWLLDLETDKTMTPLARENISPWTQPILYQVAAAAFSPKDAASYLKPIKEVVALVKACQQQGCQTALASNWNSASFAAIEDQHPDVVKLFEHRFTSGQPGQPGNSIKLETLSTELVFFKKVIDAMGGGHKYFYIDIADGTESLDAARDAGITPISVLVADDKEKADDLKLQLVKHGLISE
jgi:FMN phosphatase YigB (HAD superfamily)